MGRMTRWVARLYPRWWRERYGEEFAALLDDANPDAKSVFDVAKGALIMQMSTISAKRLILFCSIAGLTIGFASTFLLTPKYASVATLLVPAGSDPKTSVLDALNHVESSVNKRDIRIFPLATASGPDSPRAINIEFRHPDAAAAQKTVEALSKQFQQSDFPLVAVTSPSSPISPNRATMALAGLGVGVVAGGIWALVRRRLRIA